jgi:hypothetical protein
LSAKRCSTCSINYPLHVSKCPVCGEHVWHGTNVDVDADWQEAVKRLKDGGAEDKPGQRGEVRFIYETGPDGVERIFITTADLVRARLAQSSEALRVMASANTEVPTLGCPS